MWVFARCCGSLQTATAVKTAANAKRTEKDVIAGGSFDWAEEILVTKVDLEESSEAKSDLQVMLTWQPHIFTFVRERALCVGDRVLSSHMCVRSHGVPLANRLK